MQLVTKFCGEELGIYMKCVEDYPKTWHTHCENSKQQLAWCAQQNPVIKKIRESCVSPFASYEKCILANPQDVTACMRELSSFIECAERHAGGALAS